jgi:hypothetical protein
MLWSTLVFAAPPEGVDPQDLDRWEQGSAVALQGPPGCWELSGRVELLMAAYTPATLWTRAERSDHRFRGSFHGKLDQGTWTQLDYDLVNLEKPEEPAKMEVPLFPSIGKIAPNTPRRTNLPPEGDEGLEISGGEGEEAIHLFTEILDEIDPATATSYGEWDDKTRAVKLIQDVPISDKPTADTVSVVTTFPEGGPATAVDVTFPTRIRMGEGLIKATLFDSQLHLRSQKVGEVVLPALESLSFGLGALGFTVGYEQKLVYEKATPCQL